MIKWLYLSCVICLLFYSYTQVDLNLTLSSNNLYQQFQQQATQLGYFNRPVSAALFGSILLGLSTFYYLILKSNFTFKQIFRLAVVTGFILVFAYPAFSHDLFNYIFDARIVVEHQANPWQLTALDFPGDLWTRFMHWTHRTYPYGPTWLLISLPVYLLGLNKFVLTLLSFKVLGLASYLVSIFCIGKIMAKTNPRYSNLAMCLFAFNPLVLIEGLVSMHLDMVMAATMLLSIYYLVVKQDGKTSAFWLTVSIGIKYVSASVMLPMYFYFKKIITFNQAMLFSFLLSLSLTILIITQREILPWYALVPFSLGSLLASNKWIRWIMVVVSLGLLVRYLPFLYFGEYSSQVIFLRHLVMAGTWIAGGLIFFGSLRYKKINLP